MNVLRHRKENITKETRHDINPPEIPNLLALRLNMSLAIRWTNAPRKNRSTRDEVGLSVTTRKSDERPPFDMSEIFILLILVITASNMS
jgi:hypothetical protein